MKKLFLILLCAVLLLCCGVALADISPVDSDIRGSNAYSTVFYVNVNRSGAYIVLDGGMGQGSVNHGSSYTRPGLWDEWLYGFYRVQVSGPSGVVNYKWVASADQSLAAVNRDWYTDPSLTINFSRTGIYTVTVSSIVASDFFYDAYVRTWRINPTWDLDYAYGCSASYDYPRVTAAPTRRPTATPRATATPVGVTPSLITLNVTTARAGDDVTGTITRYAGNVSHMIEWVHASGYSFTQNMGTGYGAFITNIPSHWGRGYVYATLITKQNGREIGRTTATLYVNGPAITPTPRATATPMINPSRLNVNSSSVTAGEALSFRVTRYSSLVSHTVDFIHQNGAAFTQDIGTSYGNLSQIIPSGWPSGYVTVVLNSWAYGQMIGSSQGEFYVNAPVTQYASDLQLYAANVRAGQTINGYVTVYTSGVTHSIRWEHNNGSAKTTSWGASSGALSFNVPTSWPDGIVTVTMTTYRGSTILGTSVTEFSIGSGVTPRPTRRPRPTAVPTARPTATPGVTVTPSSSLRQIMDGMVYPVGGTWQDGKNGVKQLGDRLTTLTDFSRATLHTYTMWDSTQGDTIPEFTFDFNYETLGSFWIRVGRDAPYYGDDARPYQIQLYVDCDQGRKVYSLSIPAAVNGGVSGFQKIDFGQMLTGVTHMDLYVRKIRTGEVNKFKVVTADMAFCNFR